jgi:hypothetical protein
MFLLRLSMTSGDSYIFLAVIVVLALIALIYLLSPMSLLDDITARGAEFRERVDELLRRHDYPDADTKTFMVVGYVIIAIQHHRAIWLLKDAELYGSAFALVRPVFDAWLRALWINAIATPEQIGQASRSHDELRFPNIDKMLADIRPIYFGHAEQDADFKEAVDRFFYFFAGPNPKDKADPRATSLWKVLHGYTHPGARPLSRLFTGTQVKQNYSEWDIAQGLNLPTIALIFLMGPFFISMGKQAEADEVHALALQYFAEFNERLNKGS